MSKFARREKAPAGFKTVEPVLTALSSESRAKVNESHEGKRKTESLWPVHQINWQRTRYVHDMHYHYKKIDKATYDYCVRHKLIDGALSAKWKKPGYERLCCTYCINTKNYKFGTVSICRVPAYNRSDDSLIEDPFCGCRGCCSGPGGQRNIFGNKYGQYLAAIHVAREAAVSAASAAARAAAAAADGGDGAAASSSAAAAAPAKKTAGGGGGGGGFDSDSDSEDEGPSLWAASKDEEAIDGSGCTDAAPVPKEKLEPAWKRRKA